MDERGRKGVSRFYVLNFLSHSAENFCRGTLLCCRNFLVSKKVKEKREGASGLSLEDLLSHSTEKLRMGNLCFRKFLVSKIVKDKRERGGGHHDFPSKICCLTIPKNFVGETCVSERFSYRKIVKDKRERGASRRSIENLLSHNTEKLRR